ncbi:hypothetical protein BJX66DRAFT_299074 [Aspergillus keveii]|uniref:Uncharacterized protein n=1 Tax=Aspergillus keveii TaxID=714993 RepID=A0ABR4GDN8_9EURO
MSTDAPQSTESSQICTPETWRSILTGDGTKSWVLFEKGTIVILMDPTTDSLETQAIDILKEWGPVHVATPSADFNVIDLSEEEVAGYVVTGHHKDVLNYVPGDKVREGAPSMFAGLVGRGYRDEDAKGLKVVHVEDKRG